MSTIASGGVPASRLLIEPQRTLLTPSASPSVGPPDRPLAKRPRLRSTPSSISVTPSLSNESTSSADFNSARRASTLRVLNSWAQLAERYNKRLDEDDIVDLYSGAIIKDRGVLKHAPRDYHIGHFAQPDDEQDYPDADQDQDDSEQDDDDNDLTILPPSEAATDDDAPVSKKELLRGVPPLSATTDAEDLREFLEAERRRKELVGEEEEEELSPEQLSAIRKALKERSQEGVGEMASQARDEEGVQQSREHEVDTTPIRPSTSIPPSENESEDELALWTRDESTAIYPVAREESEQDVREVEQEVIELTDSDSDSDEEFEAILTRPPRFVRVSPPPVPHPKIVKQTLQSPPDSQRGRSKSQTRSQFVTKSAEVMLKSESRPRSPTVPRKVEILAHTRKPSVSKKADATTSEDRVLDQEVVGYISPISKGKRKEVPRVVEDGHQDETFKTIGVPSRGKKRKRIASSSIGTGPLTQSLAEPKSSQRSRGKQTSRSSAMLPQPDNFKPISEKDDVSTPTQSERAVSGLRSFPLSSSTSKNQKSTLSSSTRGPLNPESVRPTSHDHVSDEIPPSDPSIPVAYHYSRRHHSHPASNFSSPDQGTPGLPLHAHPPPMDPVQTQQAHYLLAQAMHQLSYLISATMPSYATYASNPGQLWHPPPLHSAFSTPIHHPPQLSARPYHTPSSSVSRSVLAPSSPIQSSTSPPLEERARSQGRSRSRGRRVSFKLDDEEAIATREHNIQSELHDGGQKPCKQSPEVKRVKGKGRAIDVLDNSLREDRSSLPQEVTRGRTPGPPSRKKNDASRGKSLSCR